jgi:hypothetical protein
VSRSACRTNRATSWRRAAAVPPPLFVVVSDTVIVSPAPAAAGAETAVTDRSGPMAMLVVLFVLLVSLASETRLVASAFAMT